MKLLKMWVVLWVLIGIVACSTVPKSHKSVIVKPDLKNKEIVSIVVPHLSDPKEIAAFNSGILSAVGSEKIVPTVPDEIKPQVVSLMEQALSPNPELDTKIIKAVTAIAMKIAKVDYLVLVNTENTTITRGILFFTKDFPGIRVRVLIYDIQATRLVGVADYYSTLPDNPNLKLGALMSSAKNAIQYLVE